MAPHSSTLAWKSPWTEEPDRLQSMGSRRVGHDWVTSLSLFTFMHWRRKWQNALENPRDGGAWWAAVYGVAQSRTRLKRLGSSSSRPFSPLRTFSETKSNTCDCGKLFNLSVPPFFFFLICKTGCLFVKQDNVLSVKWDNVYYMFMKSIELLFVNQNSTWHRVRAI